MTNILVKNLYHLCDQEFVLFPEKIFEYLLIKLGAWIASL